MGIFVIEKNTILTVCRPSVGYCALLSVTSLQNVATRLDVHYMYVDQGFIQKLICGVKVTGGRSFSPKAEARGPKGREWAVGFLGRGK